VEGILLKAEKEGGRISKSGQSGENTGNHRFGAIQKTLRNTNKRERNYPRKGVDGKNSIDSTIPRNKKMGRPLERRIA